MTIRATFQLKMSSLLSCRGVSEGLVTGWFEGGKD